MSITRRDDPAASCVGSVASVWVAPCSAFISSMHQRYVLSCLPHARHEGDQQYDAKSVGASSLWPALQGPKLEAWEIADAKDMARVSTHRSSHNGYRESGMS